MGKFQWSQKRKFKLNEVVKIKPKGGILDISDISSLDEMIYKKHEQQLLVGKTGIICGMSHLCSLDVECYDKDDEEHAHEFLYIVLLDLENQNNLEPDERTFCFRETDLESTSKFRTKSDVCPEILSSEKIKVRVDPETGEGDLVNEEDWKKLDG